MADKGKGFFFKKIGDVAWDRDEAVGLAARAFGLPSKSLGRKKSRVRESRPNSLYICILKFFFFFFVNTCVNHFYFLTFIVFHTYIRKSVLV